MLTHRELSAGTKVKVTNPGPLPTEGIKWVKDVHVNPRTRKQLLEGFWKSQRSVMAHVMYVGNESDRERLRKEGRVMLRIGDLSAQHVDVIVGIGMVMPV